VDVDLITSFRKFESPPCACVDLGWPIVLLSAVMSWKTRTGESTVGPLIRFRTKIRRKSGYASGLSGQIFGIFLKIPKVEVRTKVAQI
jgi:hypothetical protein